MDASDDYYARVLRDKEKSSTKFKKLCPVCLSTDLDVEECLGPRKSDYRLGKGFVKAYTGSCNECLTRFEIIGGHFFDISDGVEYLNLAEPK